MGSKTNNEVEWLALFQGLEMIDTITFTRLLIFGDSCQVILKMKIGYTTRSIKCRRLHSKISQLHIPESMDYYHILRANNVKANTMENKGSSLPQGTILLNDNEASFKHIP